MSSGIFCSITPIPFESIRQGLLRLLAILFLLCALLLNFDSLAYAAEEQPPNTATEESADDPVETENVGSEDTDDAQTEGEAETIEGESQTPLSESTQTTDSTDPQVSCDPPVDDSQCDDSSSNENVDDQSLVEELIDDDEKNPELPATNPSEEELTDIDTTLEELPAIYPDPYFYVEGVKHSFLPEEGDCADQTNCTLSTTPIQSALDAAAGELPPDDGIIYVEGGHYEEDLTIVQFTDLTLQGSADGNPSILAGEVSIIESNEIALNDFSFENPIKIVDSADIAITGTDQDDTIEVDLEGTVENLVVDGGQGDDEVVINLGAEETTVVVSDSGSEDDDTLVINKDEEDIDISDDQATSEDESVTFDDSIENLNIQAVHGNVAAEKAIALNGIVSISGENVSVSGEISASEIYILSADTSWVSGTLDTSAKESDQTGGVVHVLGERVALLSDALIGASGDAGGGTVLIGGDYQGKGVVPNSAQTYVGNKVTIHADALTKGNGGRVILWADKVTGFAGFINATGGLQNGDGGFVEVSGKDYLYFTGEVDLSAPNGHTGILLLDPENITIQASGSNDSELNDNQILYNDSTGSSFTISASKISNNLASANISMQANNNITLASGASITKSSGGDATLTLEAKNSITINSAISSTSNKLHLELIADSDNSGGGAITIDEDITSNNGNVTIQSASIEVKSGDVIDAGTGNVIYKPSTASATIGIGDFATGSFNLGEKELTDELSSTGTVTVGRDDGTGAVDIQKFDSAEFYNLIIKGGTTTFNGGLGMGDNLTLQVVSTGAIIDNNSSSNEDVYIHNGEILFDTASGVGTSSNPIEIHALKLAARTTSSGGVFVTRYDSLQIGTVGGVNGISTAANDGDIEITAEDLEITEIIDAGAGNITLQPDDIATNINIGGGTSDFALSDTELTDKLSSTGTVTIGPDGGTGEVNIQPVDLSSEGYNLTVRGGIFTLVSTSGLLKLANDKTLQLISTNNIHNTDSSTAIEIGGNGKLLMDAASGIRDLNGIDSIETSVATIAARTTTGIINIDSKFTGTTTIGTVGSVSGISTDSGSSIKIVATGALSMVNGTTIYAASNGIDINASGDITLSRLVAPGEVSITTTNGAITDGGDSGGADIQADTSLLLKSTTGIGTSSNPIETEVSLLAAEATAFGGGIFITNTGGLTIGTIGTTVGVTANGGGINILTRSPLNVSNGVQDQGGGSIDLTAEGSTSTDKITVDSGVMISAPGAGDISFNSGAGGVVMDGNVESGPGDIVIISDGDVTQDPNSVVTAKGIGIRSGGNIDFPGHNTVETLGSELLTPGTYLDFKSINPDLIIGVVEGIGDPNADYIIIDDPPGIRVILNKPLDPSNPSSNPGTNSGSYNFFGEGSRFGQDFLAQLIPFFNGIFSILGGELLRLLDFSVYGPMVTFELPGGILITLPTAYDLIISLLGETLDSLPAGLHQQTSFIMSFTFTNHTGNGLDSLPSEERMLAMFALPEDLPGGTITMFCWNPDINGGQGGWEFVDNVELTPEGLVITRSELFGTFVLVICNPNDPGSCHPPEFIPINLSGRGQIETTLLHVSPAEQVNLNNIDTSAVTLNLPDGMQVTMTSDIQGNAQVIPQNLGDMPGNLPTGANFVSGLQVGLSTNGGSQISFIDNSAIMLVTFDVPVGATGESLSVLRWSPMLNGGQGGWIELEAQITPDGKIQVPVFSGGTFVLIQN